MDLFKCCRCKQLLPRENFGGLTKRSDYCKPCNRVVWTDYNQKNPDRRREINNKAAAKRYKTNRENSLTYLLSHSCVDCGESDPVVLEFDHTNPGNKRAQVGDMLGNCSWSTILTEIEKCDVRCANCHRRRTARQFGWYKGGDANDTVPCLD